VVLRTLYINRLVRHSCHYYSRNITSTITNTHNSTQHASEQLQTGLPKAKGARLELSCSTRFQRRTTEPQNLKVRRETPASHLPHHYQDPAASIRKVRDQSRRVSTQTFCPLPSPDGRRLGRRDPRFFLVFCSYTTAFYFSIGRQWGGV
jgi:hypothetical protein